LWALWYTPPSTYEPRKNEQISNIEFVVKPNSTTGNTFEVESDVKEISVGISGQTVAVPNTEPTQNNSQNPPPDIPPVFSAKVIDSQGKVIKTYGNVTSTSDSDRIPVQQAGIFKVEVTDNTAQNALRMQMRAMDVTAVPNHPLDALGQWLTIISLPIFGLAAWFIVSRSRRQPKALQ
jgi:hypothetical protein